MKNLESFMQLATIYMIVNLVLYLIFIISGIIYYIRKKIMINYKRHSFNRINTQLENIEDTFEIMNLRITQLEEYRFNRVPHNKKSYVDEAVENSKKNNPSC